jgi:16S rRNA processing protein RimM
VRPSSPPREKGGAVRGGPANAIPPLDGEGGATDGRAGGEPLGPSDDDRVLLGEIGAAQGLKGEVRIRSFTQDPGDIAAYGPLEDEKGRLVEIESLRVAPKVLIARVKGVTTREGAEALARTRLYVPRTRLPARQENEWYHADLVGLAAVGQDGAALGTVVAVLNFGAGDLIEVRPAAGGESLIVPFTEEAVPEVDIVAGRLTIVPPERLE